MNLAIPVGRELIDGSSARSSSGEALLTPHLIRKETTRGPSAGNPGGPEGDGPCVAALSPGSPKCAGGWPPHARCVCVCSPPSSISLSLRTSVAPTPVPLPLPSPSFPRTNRLRTTHALASQSSAGRGQSRAVEIRRSRGTVQENILGMVVETESSDSLPGSSNATDDKPVNGPSDQRSQEKTPKKNHKAEREKLKRDQLNDLFLELSSMLDLDRQNSGKASVLGDAARVLQDLVTQVESLGKEQSALLAERQDVSSEKNELLEENTTIKVQISELQNELRARMGNNSISLSSIGMSYPMANATNPGVATQPVQHQLWSSIPNLSTVAMTHSTNTESPLHSQQHRPDVVGQVHVSRPKELQLFPGTSSSPERECSSLRNAPTSTSSLTDSLPGQLQLSLPQSSQEGSSSRVSRSRREWKNG